MVENLLSGIKDMIHVCIKIGKQKFRQEKKKENEDESRNKKQKKKEANN